MPAYGQLVTDAQSSCKENMFQLNDEHLFITLNEKPGAYEGSLGAAVFHAGGRNKPETVECGGDKEDNISMVSDASGKSTPSEPITPSREDVLEMMKRANISIEELKKGSAPKSHGKSRGKPSDKESIESSSSDSYSSSDSSEGIESAGRHTTGNG